MKPLTGKELCDILEDNGWKLAEDSRKSLRVYQAWSI